MFLASLIEQQRKDDFGYRSAYAGLVTGDHTTDVEVQFAQALGRYPLESEIPLAIKAFDTKNQADYAAYVVANFPRDPGPVAEPVTNVISSPVLWLVIAAVVFFYFMRKG